MKLDLANSRRNCNLGFGIFTAIIKRTLKRKLGSVSLECSEFAEFISLRFGFGFGFFYFLLLLCCFLVALLFLVRVPLVLSFFT